MPSSAPSRFAVPDPGPIGLAAFAATTLMLSVFNAGLLGKELEIVVLPVALIFGGIVQLIAGIFEMFRSNIFGAVAFLSYGAFWIAFNGIAQLDLGPDAGKAVGLFLGTFAILTLGLTVVTLRINAGLLTVFSLLSLTFVLLTIGNLAGSEPLVNAGGFCGLATAAAAGYCSLAGVLNATWGRTVLPIRSLALRD